MMIATFIDGPKKGEEIAIARREPTLLFPAQTTDQFKVTYGVRIPEYSHLHVYEYRIWSQPCKHETVYKFAGVGHS